MIVDVSCSNCALDQRSANEYSWHSSIVFGCILSVIWPEGKAACPLYWIPVILNFSSSLNEADELSTFHCNTILSKRALDKKCIRFPLVNEFKKPKNRLIFIASNRWRMRKTYAAQRIPESIWIKRSGNANSCNFYSMFTLLCSVHAWQQYNKMLAWHFSICL